MTSIETTAAAVAKASSDVQALQKAAQGFEALMLEKILVSARTNEGGPTGDARSMAERRLAADLAQTNPFGLAKLMEQK